MFDTLTERLTQSLRNVTGSGQLTEDNIKDTLREVRMALLEADVALPVTREFIAKVKEDPAKSLRKNTAATAARHAPDWQVACYR